ncbi:MAG: hypothetical protein WC655_21175, partial [Candidatus Hydrogenedentales bacterium]
VGGRPIALPPGTPLTQGQAVTAEVLRTSPSLQLRILPNSGQPATVPQSSTPILLAIVGRPVTSNLPLILEGRILQTPEGPVFQSGQSTLPLAAAPENLINASVSARVVETAKGLQLHVLQTGDPSAATQSSKPDLAAMLSRVFESLGKPELAARASTLIPRGLPTSEAGIRLLASLFLERGVGAELVERLASMIRQGHAAGVISNEQEKVLGTLLTRVVGDETKELQAALRVAVQSATRSPESILAQARFSQDPTEFLPRLLDDLRTALQQLKSNEQFRGLLEQTGRLQEFNSTSSSLIDRVSANQLQNLRGLETSYVYFEAAFAPGSGLNSAHIHVFGDGGGGQSSSPDNSTVVLDLSTTRLGDLWVTLSAVQGVCACVFRTNTTPVAELIDAHATELENLLTEAGGFSQAQVRTVLWDGNRFAAAVDLFRPLEGIDEEA